MPDTDSLATEGWKWEATPKTLTLNGLVMLTDSPNYNGAILFPEGDSAIILNGANSLNNINGGGVKGPGNITITGSGSLDIESTDNHAIFIDGSLTIAGGTITAACLNTAIRANGGIAITGGTITATGNFGSAPTLPKSYQYKLTPSGSLINSADTPYVWSNTQTYVHISSFDPPPPTGLPTITTAIAAMITLLLISTALWVYILRRRFNPQQQ